MALDDPADPLALLVDVPLAPLVTEERQAHLLEVEVEATGQERRQRLRLQLVNQRGPLARREGEPRLRRVGYARDRDRELAGGDVAHRRHTLGEAGEQITED